MRGRVIIGVVGVIAVVAVGLFGVLRAEVPLTPSALPVVDHNVAQNVGGVTYQAVFTPTPVSISIVTQAEAAQDVLVNIYQRVNPSVVNIEVAFKGNTDGSIDASGSGFVLDTNGHILTNAHVLQDAKDIFVTFADGYVTQGTPVGVDDYADLGVLQVNVASSRLIPVTLGDSSQLQVGQYVVAIGNPFGLLSSMTTGIISATGRTLSSAHMLNPTGANTTFSNPSIIQVDAPINPGNSGGPLMDLTGSVIGINTAIRTESGVFEGIAFAVPINTAKRVVPQLIKSGKAQYSWLGISTVSSSDNTLAGSLTVASLAEPLNLPVDHGILLNEVLPNSPAEKAGLRGGDKSVVVRGQQVNAGGDIITAINGVQLRDFDALIAYLVANTSPGDNVTLTIIRDGQTMDVQVTLEARPDNSVQ